LYFSASFYFSKFYSSVISVTVINAYSLKLPSKMRDYIFIFLLFVTILNVSSCYWFWDSLIAKFDSIDLAILYLKSYIYSKIVFIKVFCWSREELVPLLTLELVSFWILISSNSFYFAWSFCYLVNCFLKYVWYLSGKVLPSLDLNISFIVSFSNINYYSYKLYIIMPFGIDFRLWSHCISASWAFLNLKRINS